MLLADALTVKKQAKEPKVLSKRDKKLFKRKREVEEQLPICSTVKEPIAFVQNDGKIVKSCGNSNVQEWKSLALVGKMALTDKKNLMVKNYTAEHSTEKQIGLKFYDPKQPE